MAKGNGTTRSVGGSTAASGRTFRTGTGDAAYEETITRHAKDMRDSLKAFASENNWRSLDANSAIKTLSETNNIRTVSIQVESNFENGRVSYYYKTNILESLTPAYESKDHEAFQRGLSYVNNHRHNSLSEAKTFLDGWVKQLNKMKIR